MIVKVADRGIFYQIKIAYREICVIFAVEIQMIRWI